MELFAAPRGRPNKDEEVENNDAEARSLDPVVNCGILSPLPIPKDAVAPPKLAAGAGMFCAVVAAPDSLFAAGEETDPTARESACAEAVTGGDNSWAAEANPSMGAGGTSGAPAAGATAC